MKLCQFQHFQPLPFNRLTYRDYPLALHVLEHQFNVSYFLRKLLFKNPKYIFIEIPCWEFVKKNNYHYFSNEHCSYFSKENINFLMNLLGYKKIFLKFDFNKEYIISLWIMVGR